MTRSQCSASARDEKGLALLDVLSGIAIFALVAIIAVTATGQYRARAYESGVLSDAHDLGELLTEVGADTGSYPTTSPEAETTLASNGGHFTRDNSLDGYAASRTEFALCVEHKAPNGDAWAVYESVEGGITGSGRTGGCPVIAADPDAPATGVPIVYNPGTAPPPTSSTGQGAPLNVRVETVPGQRRATVTWDPVTGADQYAVYLDGAASHVWRGPDTSTVLTDLALGGHAVTVTAYTGASESAHSQRAEFTIYGDNDFIANAHPVETIAHDTPWTTRDYTNAGASAESGEPTVSRRGMWWFLKAPFSGTYRFEVIGASDGTPVFTHPIVTVWKGRSTTVGDLGSVYASNQSTGTKPVVRMAVQAGETYMIRISTGSDSSSYVGPYRLRATPGPTNDNLADAAQLGDFGPNTQWNSPVVSNTHAGVEPGEPDANAYNTMWWTFTPSRSATYNLEVIAAGDGSALFTYPHLDVWNTTETDTSLLGATYATNQQGRAANSPTLSFAARAGQTYKIRVSTSSGTLDGYVGTYRLASTPGPINDNLDAATPVLALSAGGTWTSPDTTNVFAGRESGEPDTSAYNSMWWTFTAPSTGTYTVEVIQASTGATLFTYPKLWAWQTTTTDVTALGSAHATNQSGSANLRPRMSFSAAAGATFKIRIATGSPTTSGYRSEYRLRIVAS